ncbi:MAG: ribonuclease H family protein [Promethearchaeota archaeon]
MTFLLYTDGACAGNQFQENLGGWGVVILQKSADQKEPQILNELSGAARNTTNNRMELFAVIEGLKYIKEKFAPIDSKVKIYSDSAYIVNCFKQKWYVKWQKNGWKNSKGQDVLNKDLWKKLLLFVQDVLVEFHKVKGHVGDKYNERADYLAVNAIKSRFKK